MPFNAWLDLACMQRASHITIAAAAEAYQKCEFTPVQCAMHALPTLYLTICLLGGQQLQI